MMKERGLIDAIHRQLPKKLHRQSMTFGAVFANGTPDYYYDGPKSDLWVEYKQLRATPRSWVVPKLTQQQKLWLARRIANGGNAAVVVGLPNRTAILFTNLPAWLDGKPVITAQPYKKVAEWISEYCGYSPDP